MEKVKLHYGKIGVFDIEEKEFICFDSLMNELLLIFSINELKDIVYLLTYNNGKSRREYDIIVSSKKQTLIACIEILSKFNNIKNVSLQEYDSFESAYDVALSMQECSKLCYTNKSKN